MTKRGSRTGVDCGTLNQDHGVGYHVRGPATRGPNGRITESSKPGALEVGCRRTHGGLAGTLHASGEWRDGGVRYRSGNVWAPFDAVDTDLVGPWQERGRASLRVEAPWLMPTGPAERVAGLRER